MSGEVIDLISHDRFEPYLRSAGHDPERALNLYSWNMQISASFYPLLCAIEVTLRNLVVLRLNSEFGGEWWQNTDLRDLLGQRGTRIVERASREIRRKSRNISEGRLTAELSFGFWRNMLLPKYEAALWAPLNTGFTKAPDTLLLSDLEERCESVRILRNRISHHENLLRRNITQDYSEALELLKWLSPKKAEWVKENLETMAILRRRP